MIQERIKLKEVAKMEKELQKLREALDAIRGRYRDTIQSIITQRLGNSSSTELKRTLAYKEKLTSNETAQLFHIDSADQKMEEIKKEQEDYKEERDMLLKNVPIKAHHSDIEEHYGHSQGNKGSIGPIDNVDHIEERAVVIQREVREDNLEKIEENRKKAENVEVSENIDVNESNDESVGIFKPKKDEKNYYPQEEYKFDE